MNARRDLLERMYSEFNARDIETLLKRLRSEVVWPNGMDGGVVHGTAAVRHYWTRQWDQINPKVEPIGFSESVDGRLAVIVQQVVRDLAGAVLKDTIVQLPDTFDGDLIQAMEIADDAITSHRDTWAHVAVGQAIHRFMNCFDLKDWGTMRGLLTPELRTDYSQLRGDAPGMTTADAYVGARASALTELATHHVVSNLDVHTFNATAGARVSCLIFRRRGETSFNSHAFYGFALVEHEQQWQIAGITQKIFWNEGDPEIHSGAAR